MMQNFLFNSCQGGKTTWHRAVRGEILSTNHERDIFSLFFFFTLPKRTGSQVMRYFRSPWAPGYLTESEDASMLVLSKM